MAACERLGNRLERRAARDREPLIHIEARRRGPAIGIQDGGHGGVVLPGDPKERVAAFNLVNRLEVAANAERGCIQEHPARKGVAASSRPRVIWHKQRQS